MGGQIDGWTNGQGTDGWMDNQPFRGAFIYVKTTDEGEAINSAVESVN